MVDFRSIRTASELVQPLDQGGRRESCHSVGAAPIDVRTVAGRLGHADPAITLRVYSHVLAERDKAVADLLGGLVLGRSNAG